jgi:flagellar protein FliO/FliZ
MTWMIIRLILSLAFVGGVLWFAARLAKKRGLGQSNGAIEVVARQRVGRTSTVNLVRIGDVVLVVGATEQQITLLAEVDGATVEQAMGDRRGPFRRAPQPQAEHDGYPDEYAGGYEGDYPADYDEPVPAHTGHRAAPASQGALAGSVFDKRGWGTFVQEMRERTVRRS